MKQLFQIPVWGVLKGVILFSKYALIVVNLALIVQYFVLYFSISSSISSSNSNAGDVLW